VFLNPSLRADVLKVVNENIPNKSLKFCHRIFRSALANHDFLFQIKCSELRNKKKEELRSKQLDDLQTQD
jgi:hypothetical protein